MVGGRLGVGGGARTVTTGGAGLVLVVRLEVLLHVVGTGKLLLAAGKGALDSLFSRVNLGVAGSVARRGKRLFAAVGVAEAARVALGGAVLGGGASDGNIVLVGGGTAASIV